ncbi:MAG: homogentisate 1,2-dioxygenase [Deltaproteobacteria bacterium]|nr:homogentisate 1,2-dioxygenase [Deltaproteobacteria bacterium]
MIDYRSAGRLPRKPHTVFRDDAGNLLHEYCFTRVGFDGPFTISYHRRPPQDHGDGAPHPSLWPQRVEASFDSGDPLRRRHLRSQDLGPGGSPTSGRRPLLFNADLTLGVVCPTEDDAYYFANGDGDDLFYIHKGGGEVRSSYGNLTFGPGDYVLIPRSVIHRIVLDGSPQHWFWMECRSGLRTPNQYRNPVGQLRMDAPYTHRDFRSPALPDVIDPDGPRVVVSKRRDRFSRHLYRHEVLDTVGWDGTVYPFVFPISRFSPKAGQVHLPPTVHGTFATGGSLVCSFVPRVVDFGEGAIPCPYPHSNVDVDEVIFYCDGDFTSRRGVSGGSLSFHPAGVPHGPQPGAYERSVGVKSVTELAVMIDTFEPLRITEAGMSLEKPDYDESWWSA